MKTMIITSIMKQAAKASMNPADFAAFENRLRYMRWNQVRKNFPDLWDMLSDKFEIARESISSAMSPDEVAAVVIPGGIERYPEVFEPFRAQLEGISWAADAAAEAASSLADTGSEAITAVAEGSDGLLDVVVDALGSIFEFLGELL